MGTSHQGDLSVDGKMILKGFYLKQGHQARYESRNNTKRVIKVRIQYYGHMLHMDNKRIPFRVQIKRPLGRPKTRQRGQVKENTYR